jgi:hypothetical protein
LVLQWWYRKFLPPKGFSEAFGMGVLQFLPVICSPRRVVPRGVISKWLLRVCSSMWVLQTDLLVWVPEVVSTNWFSPRKSTMKCPSMCPIGVPNGGSTKWFPVRSPIPHSPMWSPKESPIAVAQVVADYVPTIGFPYWVLQVSFPYWFCRMFPGFCPQIGFPLVVPPLGCP